MRSSNKKGQGEFHLAPLSGHLTDRHSPPKNDRNISVLPYDVRSGKQGEYYVCKNFS